MSNHLAIATVTAALRTRLELELGRYMSGATATAIRPQTPSGDILTSPGVNIYLYQVTPSTALRNVDLPTRRADGQLLQRPTAALELHYLLSFYGNEATLEPQVAMGIVVRTLHAQPVLSRELIEEVVTVEGSSVVGSDLASAVEQVRFTPVTLSLDELNKFWSLLQTPYVPSVAYMGSVVLLESEDSTRTPLPVRRLPVITVLPLRRPVIEQLLSQATADAPPRADQPILVGHRLVIRGQGLSGEDTVVRLGDLELSPESQSGTRLTVTLPDTLRAGVRSVQVVHRGGVESGVASFVLRPRATFSKVDGDIRVDLEPQVREGQRVALLLNEYQAHPPARESRAYRFTTIAQADSASLTFAVPDVAPGDYLLRVQVDGAESPLDFDEAAGRYGPPQVTLP